MGLVLPGMIAHASGEVMRAADDLAHGVLPDLSRAMEALSRGQLTEAHVQLRTPSIVVHSQDEIGAMATSFNTMLVEVERATHALDAAGNRLRMYTEGLEDLVAERTRALLAANAALEEAQTDRRVLLGRTVRAGEEERTRLAADLHDGPIQRLAALGLLLDRCELRLDRGDVAATEALVARARAELADQIRGLRRLMSELRPPVLDEGGLPAALSDHLAAFRSRYGVVGELQVDPGRSARPADRDDRVSLGAGKPDERGQTCGAGSVVVSVRGDEEGLSVEIEDDGVGMDVGLGMAELLRDGHFGLAGMRERVELVGGTFDLDRGTRRGTRVRFLLPATPASVGSRS